jgi:hypothetical protein
MKITQWDKDNANARQILHVKIALAKSELKTLQFLVSEAKQKLFGLNDQFAALSNSEGFTTVEACNAAQ